MKSPLTRAAAIAALADGLWRTADDLARAVTDAIPLEVASRFYCEAYPDSWAGVPADKRAHRGRKAIALRVMNDLVHVELAETKREGSTSFYRVPPATDAYRRMNLPIDTPLPAAALTTPATTKTGLTVAMVRQIIADHPGLTDREYVLLLDPCFIDGGCWAHAMQYTKHSKGRRPLTEDDHAAARLLTFRDLASTLIARGLVRGRTEMRYELVGPGEVPDPPRRRSRRRAKPDAPASE